MQEKQDKSTISEDIINLVIARLETIPSSVELSVGDGGNYSVKELIEKVRANDDIGKKMIEMQLDFLRSLSKLPTQEPENVPTNH